ncbi:MAG: DUF1549 and DUF1553 domain-containing protein, partial [Phycisphaerae bacterium]|nr:DUF1549 and DUF1553 domain-containing protein [Phycisphaerae bacterium]
MSACFRRRPVRARPAGVAALAAPGLCLVLAALIARAPARAGSIQAPDLATARRTHWAFQPVQRPPLPEVRDQAWAGTPIDRFVLARLEATGLAPSPPAGRGTLIRRLYFDLLGLPPTFVQVRRFLADSAPGAYERLVDRLLNDPAYGERWGRHWLDVARYADTKGYVGDTADNRYPFAWTYRDYVIDAFNADKPYDRFIVEQIAADQLDKGSPPADALSAMGFLTVGRRFTNKRDSIIDDRIDVVTRGLLGLTVTCARCHDHKYDPVQMTDYYALYGVFRSSREPGIGDLPEVRMPPPSPAYDAYRAELARRLAAIDNYVKSKNGKLNQGERNHVRKLERKVNEHVIGSPHGPGRAMILQDEPEPFDPYVFTRGDSNQRGESTARRFLQVLAAEGGPKPFVRGSGRFELARAIASADNPLTARVLVNRIWHHHFGRGLVETTSDFGFRGHPPTHPGLLDHLAGQFVIDRWSIKRLHRRILLSSTYRQASADRSELRPADPENRLLWRQNRRRLEFEPLRDALLSVAGHLDRKMGGKGVKLTGSPASSRRAVYAWIDRQVLPDVFRIFDFASPDASSPHRPLTTVPQQALFMMNGAFVQ